MSALNLDVACVDKPSKTKIGLFNDDPERFPELSATVAAVNDAKQALADLLPELRKKLGIPPLSTPLSAASAAVSG